MPNFLSIHLLFFIAVALFFTVRTFVVPRRFFELPTMASLLILAYQIPQAIASERNGTVELYDTFWMWSYAALCLLALAAGFYFTLAKRRTMRAGFAKYHQSFEALAPKLRNANAILIVAYLIIGRIAVLGLGSASVAEMGAASGGSWTGIGTFYYVLAMADRFALGLAVILFLQKRDKVSIILLGIIVIITLLSLQSTLKRSIIFETGIIALGSFCFLRHYVLPRTFVICASIAGMLLVTQIGTLRGYVSAGRGDIIDAVQEGVLTENFAYFEMEDSNEMREMASIFAYLELSGNYDYGTSYWDHIVHRNIPAFIFGRDFKNALQFEQTDDADASMIQDSVGAAQTGYSDSFRSFGFFGIFVFAIIGSLFGFWYYGAARGDLLSIFLYLNFLNDGIAAILIKSSFFFGSLPLVFALAAPIIFINSNAGLRFLGRRQARSQRRRQSVSRRFVKFGSSRAKQPG